MVDNSTKTAFDPIANAPADADGFIELPLLLLQDQVVMPNTITPAFLNDDEVESKLAAYYSIEHRQTAIFIRQKPASEGLSPLDRMAATGTESVIIDLTEPDSPTSMQIMAQGRRRVQVVAITQEEPFLKAKARVVTEDDGRVANHSPYVEEIRELFHEIVDLVDTIPETVEEYIFLTEDYSELTDMLSAILPLATDERQRVLDEYNLEQRLHIMASFLERELQSLEVQEDLSLQVQDEFSRVQREMFLREQMRIIQDELGEGEGSDNDMESLRQRLIDARLPEEAHTQAMRELKRLRMTSSLSPEASVIRSYLDWMLDIPWYTASKDNLNLRHAENVLNREHYGLEKVKERILEHIAVRKLAKEHMKTPILCFVGPPGVGKTSLGKSIAEALGREFVRVSLGGVRDEAEIRGHRRTYIGALPGRIIQTMKRAGTVNPLFMLDEIDKMSEDYRGDPASALLEVLDPEQNDAFSDHYLEVPYDLSDVLFIATANELHPLPEALEDRMEIIEFHAYTEEEKLAIAKRFLIPKQLVAHGISRRGIQFQTSAIQHIIRYYTMEAGVRNLEREIANVCRKITRLAAMRKKYPKRITPHLVEKYLGAPYFIDPQILREDAIGLVAGLVWTSGGGDIQLIEASLLPGKGNLTLTGQLGDVLQESAQIALNYLRSRADDLDIPHEDFENYDIHIHLPEGSVPKEGPSAGITLAIALISIFTEQKVRSHWAMTGEVTLRGHVLPVGGIKEKVLAARRRNIQNIILPADNKKDLVDVPKTALRDLRIEFVDHMQQVMDLVLMEAPEQRLRDLDLDEDEDENEDAGKDLDTGDHDR